MGLEGSPFLFELGNFRRGGSTDIPLSPCDGIQYRLELLPRFVVRENGPKICRNLCREKPGRSVALARPVRAKALLMEKKLEPETPLAYN
jgi:hypothetical protein